MHAGEIADTTLGLGDDLMGDDEYIGRRGCQGSQRLGQRGGEVVAGLYLGYSGQGDGADSAAHRPRLRASCMSMPRVLAAPPWRSAKARSSASRSSAVSTSRARDGTDTISPWMPLARAPAR